MTTTMEAPSEAIEKKGVTVEEARRDIEAKKKALEQPIRRDVSNQPYSMWDKMGVYTGSWLGTKDGKINHPGGGQGTLVFNDGKSLIGTWNKNGNLEKGTIKTGSRTIEVKNARFDSKGNFIGYNGYCVISVDGKSFRYHGLWDKNLNLVRCEAYGMSINISHEGGKKYLINSKQRKVELGNVDEDAVAVRIIKALWEVKSSEKTLNHFESENGVLQADYDEDFWLDTDLGNYSKIYTKTGISGSDLVKWLNASRGDWDI